MMLPLKLFLIVVMTSVSVPIAAETVVMQHGETQVTLTDLRRSIEQTIPAHQLGHFYADRQRLAQHAVNFFTVRKLAEMAQQRELSDAEAWQVEEAKMRALSRLQIDHLVATAPQPDYEQLAKDTYLAHPERYHTAETVQAQHILINTRERSPEDALARAEQVLAELQQGADFAELARQYSDDPSVADNDGDLGFFQRDQMVEPFAEAAFALTEPGELAGPVQTNFGYHIIQLLDRRPAELRPFEEVQERIINAERDKFRERVVSRITAEIAALPDVDLDQDQLMEGLYRPLPFQRQ